MNLNEIRPASWAKLGSTKHHDQLMNTKHIHQGALTPLSVLRQKHQIFGGKKTFKESKIF